MSQITTGIRSILSLAPVYRLMQNTFGRSTTRSRLVDEYFAIDEVDSILDIGCGPANILAVLPNEISYTGFDASHRYIDFAQKKYAHRNAIFHARTLSQSEAIDLKKYDLVLAMGVLHHLQDSQVTDLLELAKTCLSENGKLFTIDPCYIDNQRLISKFFVSRDRGQNVRRIGEYERLAKEVFCSVKLEHLDDLSRLPYDHALMLCSHH